jgi:hypothetical protein
MKTARESDEDVHPPRAGGFVIASDGKIVFNSVAITKTLDQRLFLRSRGGISGSEPERQRLTRETHKSRT